MNKYFSEVKRHLFLYGVFVKNCIMRQMEYRANFFMMMSIESMFLVIKILYASVVYGAGVKIYGFSADAISVFIGTYILATGIYMAVFYSNLSNIQKYVRDGSLDMMITKPVSLQFLVTLRYVDIGGALPNLAGGLIMIITGWKKANIPVNFSVLAGFVIFFIGGIIVGYSIMLFPQLLSFWTVKIDALREISDSIWDFNNMPMIIYNRVIQVAGIFFFPIFLVTNFSPLWIMGKLSVSYLIWGLVAPIVFFTIIRFFWKRALRSYCSASS